MVAATITSKSQITIPAQVRNDLNIRPGDKIEFIKTANGHYEVVAVIQDVSQIKGMIKTDKIVSLEEMDKAIRSRASEI
ncbi:hypothetical protein MNBD_GAMMA10-3132 [hydrothermal vent metagenome]|uniref:SpoVT-AbrB domain-containing protein n=1 Tax=hydrothermal vent metagenome TaxID=652676 RepID=A0A3B0YPK4_9ZZZZ